MRTVETIVHNRVTYRRYPNANGHSERAYFTPNGTERANGRKRLHEEIWQEHNHGNIPPGHHIHHIDGNPSNNDPSNLEAIPRHEHYKHHTEQRRNDPEWIERWKQWQHAGQQAAREWHTSKDGRKWHSKHAKQAWEHREEQARTCEQCGNEYHTRATHKKERFCSGKCKSAWRRDSGVDNETRTCAWCGNDFVANKYSKTKTCNRSCAGHLRRTK